MNASSASSTNKSDSQKSPERRRYSAGVWGLNLRFRDQGTIGVLLIVPFVVAALCLAGSREFDPTKFTVTEYRYQVDLNTATSSELQTLPGIGETLAQRIVEYRKNTPFESSEEIRNIKGIGPKKYEALLPYLSGESERVSE